MGGIVRLTFLSLQEAVEGESIGERMAAADRGRRWQRFKDLIGWKGVGCLGGPFGLPSPDIIVRDDDADHHGGGIAQVPGPLRQEEEEEGGGDDAGRAPAASASDPGCVGHTPTAAAEMEAGMNLAAALAAERSSRAAEAATDPGAAAPKVSLMRLLEETDGGDEKGRGGEGVGIDSVCCVCMARKKGAAFIPCGHTFCRVCSREVWLSRGSCPLCNRPILEILDIF